MVYPMDPRHTDAEDEQFLLNMIGEGQGDVAEQVDDGSNTDIYLNMTGCIVRDHIPISFRLWKASNPSKE